VWGGGVGGSVGRARAGLPHRRAEREYVICKRENSWRTKWPSFTAQASDSEMGYLLPN